MYGYFWYEDTSSHEPILLDAFPEWEAGGGIFEAIMDYDTMPWENDIDAETLDLEYFGNRSGSKFCSPLVKHLLNEDGELDSAAIMKLAKVIAKKYKIPWNRLWSTYEVNYSPLENYNISETTQRQLSNSESEIKDQEQAHTGTDTLQHGLVDTTVTDSNITNNDYIYGYNSAKESDSDKAVRDEDTTVTDTRSGSDVTTKNLVDSTDDNRNRYNKEDEIEYRKRSGNIGVTTNQALLEAERKAWQWNYYEQVFRDIDKELTLAFFDSCRV